MALQFQPPEWLIKQYIDNQNRNPAVEGLQAAGSLSQMYLQQKNQKELLSQKAAENVRQEKELAIKQGTYAHDYDPSTLPGAGGAYNQYSPKSFGQAESPTLTDDAQMRSMLTQEGGPATLGPSAGATQGAGPRSSILNHWDATNSQGIGMGPNPSLAPAPKNPQEEANLRFAETFPQGGKHDRHSSDQKRTYTPTSFLNEDGNPVMGRFDTRDGIPEIQDENGTWIEAPPGTLKGYAPSYGIDPSLGGLQKRTPKGVTSVSSPVEPGPGNDTVNLRKTAPKLADRFDQILDETSPDKNQALRVSVDAASSASQVRGILKDPNPSQVGLQSLGFYLARMSGSNSQLSDAERTTFEQPLALLDKVVNKGYKVVAGDLSPKMRQDLTHLSETIGRKAQLQGQKLIDNQKLKARQTLGSYYTLGLNDSFPSMESLSVSSEEMLGGKIDEGVQSSTMTYSDAGKEARFQAYKAKSVKR